MTLGLKSICFPVSFATLIENSVSSPTSSCFPLLPPPLAPRSVENRPPEVKASLLKDILVPKAFLTSRVSVIPDHPVQLNIQSNSLGNQSTTLSCQEGRMGPV